MANFDESKKASMDDMENVTGGTSEETFKDQHELWKRGFFRTSKSDNVNKSETVLHRLGFKKCQIHCDSKDGNVKNVYADKNGNIMSREEFWNAFMEWY